MKFKSCKNSKSTKVVTAALAAALSVGTPAAAVAQGAAPAGPETLDTYSRPQRLVSLPDGRRMNLHCTGSGGPTVLLEGGWTVTTLWWRTIQVRVAKTARVCSYDRAGYGFSDAGALPRSAKPIARDLVRLLKAAGERGPYVVVAHSLGGLDARIFAHLQRRDVRGLLLIDPTVPWQVAKMGAVSPSYRADMEGMTAAVAKCARGIIEGTLKPDTRESRPCVDPASKSLPEPINAAHRAHQMTAGYQHTAASELQSLEQSSREVESDRRSYGAMPIIVMTAEKANSNPDLPAAEQSRLDAMWWSLHEQVARLSSRGEHRMVVGASHFIPKDDPGAVVAAIEELVRKARP